MDWEEIKERGWQLKHHDEIRILSIDGGGIRGIFAAKYLAEVEKQTGRKIHEFFDLIVGTSTGGIIALGLGAGISAKEMVDMYKENAKVIFKRRRFSRKGIFRRKYNHTGLETVLRKTFEEKKMEDSQVMLCIPSIEFNNARPKVYKTEHHKSLFKDGAKEMWEVAMATSAAPTYFPAAKVFEEECNIDGGMWANNPSLVGIAEAVKNNISLEKIKLLSIGTGKNMFRESYKVATKSSVLRWGGKIIELILNAQSQSTVYMAKYLLGEGFTEVNFELPNKVELDATDENTIEALLNEAVNKFQDTYKVGEKVEEKFFI